MSLRRIDACVCVCAPVCLFARARPRVCFRAPMTCLSQRGKEDKHGFEQDIHDSLAERSKAVAQGAIP